MHFEFKRYFVLVWQKEKVGKESILKYWKVVKEPSRKIKKGEDFIYLEDGDRDLWSPAKALVWSRDGDVPEQNS